MKQLLFILLIAGCTPVVSPVSDDFVMTESLRGVKAEFVKIPKEDQDLIYKQFAGGASFIKNAKNLDNSAKFEVLLGKVQSSYGWDRDRYPKFTDAVSNYLVEQGFDKPRSLSSDSDKRWLYEIFNSLAGSCK